MGEPGFWDDQERAAQISTEHSRVTRKLDRYERLQRDYEDAKELLSLDGSLEDEIAEQIRPIQSELERLQGNPRRVTGNPNRSHRHRHAA